MLKCAFWYRVLHGTEIVRNCYAWDADASKQINTKATTFVGSAHRLHIRSGDNGLKNIYLDVYDGNGKGSSISFLSDGEKAISYSVNGEVVWKIKL